MPNVGDLIPLAGTYDLGFFLTSDVVGKTDIDYFALADAHAATGKYLYHLIGSAFAGYKNYVTLADIFNSTEATQIIANCKLAMYAIANSETAMNALLSSNIAMQITANSSIAVEAFANSIKAMQKILNSQTMLQNLVNSDFFDFIVNSQVAMQLIANSSLAIVVITSSQKAMEKIANSYIAMQEIIKTSAINDIAQAIQTDTLQFITTLEQTMPAVVIAKYIARLAGLNPADYAGMNAVANSATAMNAIANSATAMNAVANSATAMNAVINSSTALNAVINSSTAMNAVANSATAMNAVANSAIALNAVLKSSTARSAICVNGTPNNNLQSLRSVLLNTLNNTTYFQKVLNSVMQDVTSLFGMYNGSPVWNSAAVPGELIVIVEKAGSWLSGVSTTTTLRHLQNTSYAILTLTTTMQYSSNSITSGGVAIGGIKYEETGDCAIVVSAWKAI